MQLRRDWVIDELEADQAPGSQMLGKERCSVDFWSGLERYPKRPGRTQRGRKAPRRFFEAGDLDAGGAALDEQLDGPGVEGDCRPRRLLLRQNPPPHPRPRVGRLDASDRRV